MASIKFTKEQMTTAAKNGASEMLNLVNSLGSDEFDYIDLDCQLRRIEREVEELRYRLNECDGEE